MRSIQEQEHMDFEMGAADESTNAYNHSKATIKVRQDGLRSTCSAGRALRGSGPVRGLLPCH